MREGGKQLLLGLRFAEGEEDPCLQVLAHLRRDLSNETVLEVMWALWALNGIWPDADKWFGALIRTHSEVWLGEVASLPLAERFIVSADSLEALGEPLPERSAKARATMQSARRGLN